MSISPKWQPLWDRTHTPDGTLIPQFLTGRFIDIPVDNAALMRLAALAPPEDKPPSRKRSSHGSTAASRAREYMKKVDPAVSGQKGHDTTYRAACTLVVDFDLTPEEALPLLIEWNEGCEPPWSESDLMHKLHDADKATGERGRLLNSKSHESTRRDSHPASQNEFEPFGEGNSLDGETGREGKSFVIENDDDPHALSREYLKRQSLVFWRGEFHRHNGSSYETQEIGEIKAGVTAIAKLVFDRRAREESEKNSGDSKPPPPVRKVSQTIVSDAVNALKSICLVPGSVNQPSWLRDPYCDPTEIVSTKNGLLHLTALARGDSPSEALLDPTPDFFNSAALGCRFEPDSSCPEWLNFMNAVFGDDHESIDLLAEWFGYQLTTDTRHHKMLLIIGPPRSGKGTIGRVLKLLLGPGTIANPTLGSLAGSFGLWPLLNKTAAIISDARLSGQVDAVAILERLLSISGGDPQNVERKCLPTICGQSMPVRFTILTNELPRLTDASGAIASRFLILKMSKSFLGSEDKDLDEKLSKELPGILNWSIEGWKRLRERGRFTQSESGNELVNELRDLSSPVGSFVRECCVVGPDWYVECGDLYAEWKAWCEVHGRSQPGTDSVFGRDLRSAVPGISKKRPRIEGNRIWTYSGIGLNPNGPRWSMDQTTAGKVEFEEF